MGNRGKTHEQIMTEARRRVHPRPFVGEVSFYCINRDCAARQIRVWTKEYTSQVPVTVLCPYCGRPTTTDSALTIEEVEVRRVGGPVPADVFAREGDARE
jgi:hypothetical protein